MAILTGKDAILKEVRDFVIQDDSDRLREISPYLSSYWRELSVKHACVCLDERIAIPKAIKHAVLEDIHSTHPGSLAMLSLAQNIWWPYIHRGAKMGLVDYLSRNPFARAKKISTYDENFVVAKISIIRISMKNQIKK